MELKELGKRCKKFRETLGKTQKDVAKDCCISREVISDFENGRSRNLDILFWYIERGFDIGKC